MDQLKKYRRNGLILASFIFAVDQATKLIVMHSIGLRAKGQIELLPFFNLTWAENYGVSMGMLTASSEFQRWALVALTAIIAIAVAVWMWKETAKWDIVALSMVLGGPLCGWLLGIDNSLDMASWRYMFLVIAIPNVLLAIAAGFYFVDTPETREGMSRYLAEITYYDSQVGEALQLLDKHELSDNTLVVVVSEQGSSMPFAKWTCYDNGLQSGLIARWPGRIEPGSENPAMIEYIDLLPTFVGAAGGEPDVAMQGESLLPVFAGKQNHKQHVFGIMTTRGINSGSDHFGIRSVRSEKYKYIWNLTADVEFRNACTTSPEFKSWKKLAATGNEEAIAKVKRYQIRPEVELYDVENDPLELYNLASDEQLAGVKAELRARLDQWMQQCGDKGQATEMQALEHMNRGRKRNKRGSK